MGAVLDTKALGDAVAEIKSATASIGATVEAKVKEANAPILARLEAVESRGRERPDLTGTTEDGRRLFRGVNMRDLFEEGRYKGAIGVPNMTAKDIRSFRLSSVMRYLARGRWDANVGCERDVFEEVAKQKAALQLGDDSAAGFYIPNEVMDTIIDPLRATSVKSQLGMQMLTGLTASPIDFPRQVGVETAYMVGEDVEITHSNQTADQISLSPHMAAVLTSASASLLQKAPGVVEARIRRSITRTMELKEDQQLFEGTGIGANVLGIGTFTGINTVSFSGVTSATVWEKLQQMIRELEVDNVEITGGKFVMHAQAWHFLWLKQIVQMATDKAFAPFLTITPGPGGIPQKFIHGYPVVICNTLAASTTTILYFCNWPELMWAEWLNPGIAFSDVADDAFKKVKGYFRIVKEFDVNAEHPESICTGTALTF